MKEVAAYVLCLLGGNKSPDAAAVKSVITAAGGEADDAAVDAVVAGMDGKDFNEVLLAGKTKLDTVSIGGGGGGGDAGGAAAEEKKKSSSEESMGGGMDMMGGDDY